MPQAPQEFVDRLHTTFEGRLRVRWSNAANEFQIEQHVARGMVNFPAGLTDDENIRLRDGFFHVMSVRNGDRMPCPKCNNQLKVPLRELRELSCPRCKANGVEHRVSAGFFPLDDTLIQHLESIDPLKGMSRAMRNKIDAHNAAHTAAQRQHVLDKSWAKGADDFTKIAGIQSVGYTGKVQSGASGPGTL